MEVRKCMYSVRWSRCMFDFDQILKSLLSGETCVFIDGYRHVL